MFFLGRKDSFGFFGSAFAALVLGPMALFVVFLLAVALKFGWVLPQYAAMYLVLIFSGFGVVFLILRKRAIFAVFGQNKR